MSSRNGTKPHRVEARLAHQAIIDHERKVDRALQKLYRRESFEPSTKETPLEEIFAAEESLKCPRCSFVMELPAAALQREEEQALVRREAIKRFAEFCSWDGIRPWNVLRNVYAIFAHMGLRPWCRLTLREKAAILGDSHGSEHFRGEKIVNFLRRQNAASYKAPGQKQIEARGSYSDCQQGNSNRRRRQNRSRHRNKKMKEKKQKA